MTYENIVNLAREAMERQDLDLILSLINHSNSNTLIRYSKKRRATLKRYEAYRKQFDFFSELSDQEIDDFFTQANSVEAFKLIIESEKKQANETSK